MFSPPAPMMRQYCERNELGTGPVLDEDEGEEVLLRNEEVTLAFSPESPEGLGSLTVTTTRVVWLSSEDQSKAFDFDVAYICLHAISKDPGTFPNPCIYCQLAVEEEDVLKEAFFAPSDGEAATLQALFEAFSKAAELNPEPGDEGAGAGEEEGLGGGAGGLVFDHGSALSAEQERVLAHLDSVLVVPEGMEAVNGQFDDADVPPEDGEGDLANGHGAGANGHAPSS
ncbi:conserved unknown protein [Ectocarpus siliculosus]|uniref:Chloride conductance regulatory protein ICln n=1 Tax=Ectocarpus siliculosus TaxID=2880 RepID=D7G4C9_ECTSI|nr:conserved unknown protein [Ectocarpus siliculosus]|eukprot:CBJ33675.1 conserved unknown protein [Ectocarpus siliculosus]